MARGDAPYETKSARSEQPVRLRVARRGDELDEISLDPLVRVDAAHEDAKLADRRGREDGMHVRGGLGLRRVAHPVEDLALLGLGRIADRELHQEAVDLRLGQRVGAFVLDRVLRREDEERVGQRVVVSPMVTCRSCIASRSADCTLAGARLISSASTRFAKIGPAPRDELLRLRVEDERADEIGRAAGRA